MKSILTFPFGPSTSVLRDFKNKFFCDFFYLTLLYRYRASDFQFPFGPSTSVLCDTKTLN